MPRGARLAISAGALAALVLFVALRFNLTADVTHFLPAGSDARLAQLNRALADSEVARTMVLLFEGPDAADRAEVLAGHLRDDERFERVVSGVEQDRLDAVRESLFDRRYLLADRDLDRAVRELNAALLVPHPAEQRAELLADPLGAWRAWQRRLADAAGGGLTIDGEGRLVTPDGAAAPVFARTAGSALKFEDAAPAVDALADVDAARTGAHFYAVGAERSIRDDVRRISLLSALGIVLLFGLAYRSAPALVLAFLPSGVGVLAGLATCLLLWGRVHGLTLAFGASLLGICVDYPVHLLAHHRLLGDPDAARRAVRPGLLLGAGTTLAGFGGLVLTSFPGIREIAVFAAAGVAGALATTLFMIPPLLRRRSPASPRSPGRLRRRLASARPAALALVLVAVALCALALPRLEWDDTVAALSSLDPDLQAQEARIQARISRDDPGRLVLVFAPDVDAALPVVEAAAQRLDAAVAADELTDYRALTDLLPSTGRQRERAAAWYGAEPADAVRRALTDAGLAPEPFGAALVELAGPAPTPLGWEEAAAGPAGELLRPHVLPIDDGVAVLAWLRGLRDADAVAERLSDLGPDVLLFEQAAFLDSIQADYRLRTSRLVALGLFAVAAVLLLRYRRVRPTLAAFAPAVLAAATSLAILSLAGARPHLLHLASTLLVLSMGVDFGVFLVEHRDREASLAASMRAVAVAAGTTVLSFGALALSSQPALRAIGLTCGLGVLLALVLAPAGLALVGSTEPALSDGAAS